MAVVAITAAVLTPDDRRRLATAPLPIVRVHGRTASRAGASVRPRGAKPQSPAGKWIANNRPRPGRSERTE